MTEKLEEQMTMFDLGLLYGKMSPEPTAATKGKTSGQCLKPSQGSKTPMLQFLCLKKENGQRPDASWETVGALPGAPMMLNTGMGPLNGESASTLSQILEANVPEKYYLSKKACAGILRRAEARGKELPKILKEALVEVLRLEDSQAETEQNAEA